MKKIMTSILLGTTIISGFCQTKKTNPLLDDWTGPYGGVPAFNQYKIEDIKPAFEIAMHGTQGFRPDKDNYTIDSIKDKTFSGYHILAYYYVSWSLAIPEMVPQLNLPYAEEYELAKDMYKTK